MLIDGLTSDLRFNGQVGQLIGCHGDQCLVQLPEVLGGLVLAVRARHLHPLPARTIVELHGLSAAQLNGEIATVESSDPASLRYVVNLRDRSTKKVLGTKVRARCRLWNISMNAPDSLQWRGEQSCLFIDGEGHHRHYFLHLPIGFSQSDKWPLLVYMHGTGGGTLFTHSKKSVRSEGMQFAARTFIVVSPACEWSWKETPHSWVVEVVRAFIVAGWVDVRRVYLCGVSMGGMGTWEVATQAPELFAAIAPIAAHHKKELESTIEAKLRGSSMPVFVTHSEVDETCPMSLEQPLWDKFQGDVNFTKRTLASDHCKIHEDALCTDRVVYDWMLEHHLDVSA